MTVYLLNFAALQCTALFLGVLLDLLFGDPKRFHIIILIGRLITALEARLRNCFAGKLRLAGLWLLFLTLLITLLPAAALLFAAWRISTFLFLALEALLYWQLLAGRELCRQSMAVSRCLKKNDLPAARQAVSMIVGRDTETLDRQGVIRAAAESVAENCSDGVIAPLFYSMLLGPLGALAYKVINTLDSMVGYKNSMYIDLGRASAKTDDAVNFIPARLSALLMLLAALLAGFDAKAALHIFLRDRKNHESPNSGQTEAVTAGALHIRLGGPTVYKGVLTSRKYIGDDLRPASVSDIARANVLMLLSSALMLFIAALFTFLVY